MEIYKKALILEHEFEAQLVGSVLGERGIPHRIRSYHDTAFDGLYQTQKGWGYVSAPEQYHGQIKEIISSIREYSHSLENENGDSL